MASNIHPILLVPDDRLAQAAFLAEEVGLKNSLTIFALDDFISAGLMQLSVDRNKNVSIMLRGVIHEYNLRVKEVETDLRLKIHVQ